MAKPGEHRAPPYTEAQTKRWLCWLAKSMQQQGQTVFLIEQLQPTWLSTCAERRSYLFSSRLLAGLLLSQPLWWLSAAPGTTGRVSDVILGLFAGLILGLSIGVADVVLLEAERTDRRSPTVLRRLRNVLIMVAVLGLTCCVFFGLLLDRDDPAVHWLFSAGMILALVWGMRATQLSLQSDIHTVETLTWSWASAFKGAVLGFAFGPAITLIWAVVLWFQKAPFDHFEYLGGGLILGICAAPMVGAWAGLRQGVRELKTRPNQGIALAIRSTCYGAPVIVLIGSVLAVGGRLSVQFRMLGEGFLPDLAQAIREKTILTEVINVLCVTLFFMPFFGAFDVMNHYLLRFMLFILGRTPLNYARFLDHAANDLNFLQRVGGGYIFIHRILLEHFAAMEHETHVVLGRWAGKDSGPVKRLTILGFPKKPAID